jgi:hypothetical protein
LCGGTSEFWAQNLEECGIQQRRMACNSEEGQGSHRAVVPILMMMIEWSEILHTATYLLFASTNYFLFLLRFICDILYELVCFLLQLSVTGPSVLFDFRLNGTYDIQRLEVNTSATCHYYSHIYLYPSQLVFQNHLNLH